MASLLIAGSAGAEWTAPQELPDTNGRLPLVAAFGSNGSRYIGVFGPFLLHPPTPHIPVAFSSAVAGGAYGAATELPDGLGAPLAISPAGEVLAVGGPRSPLDDFGGEGERSRLRVGIGRLGSRLQRVATGRIIATSTLASAVNNRGDAAVVYARCRDKRCLIHSVWATFRRAGHGFSAPVVLAKRTGFPSVAVALNARGDALVPWEQHLPDATRHDVHARRRTASGVLGPTLLIDSTRSIPALAVTLSDQRRGVVCFYGKVLSEGPERSVLRVSTATVHADGTVTGPRILDGPIRQQQYAVTGYPVRAILGPDGITTAAWTGTVDGHYAVRAVRITAGAIPQTLSPPGTDVQLMALAGDRAGDAVAAWVPTEAVVPLTAAPGVGVAIRTGSFASFAPPQLVLSTTDTAVEEPGTAAAAIAPGGHVLVAGGPPSDINGPLAIRVTERSE